jgi:NADPH-dependent 2,4-dienoyl-CoA reductase/sulfur reductase-like enzyme
MAIGGKPATEFLNKSPIKLNVDNYVYVDKHMRTNVPDVYAAGDITYFHRSCLKGLEFTMNRTNAKLDHVSIGHWGVASLQGRFAALSILNEDAKIKSNQTEKEISIVPFFWSVHYNKSLRFAGYNEKFDKVLFFEDKTKQNEFKFAAFYFIKDRCVGVCSLDWDPLCAIFAETLYSGIEVRKEHIEKDPLDIRKLLA